MGKTQQTTGGGLGGRFAWKQITKSEGKEVGKQTVPCVNMRLLTRPGAAGLSWTQGTRTQGTVLCVNGMKV